MTLLGRRPKKLALLVVLCGAGLAGCVPAPEPFPKENVAAAAARGRQLFKRESCVSCHVTTLAPHVPDAAVGFVPDLRKTPRRTRDWYLAYLIRPRALLPWSPMPSYGYLSGQELAALIAFLQSLPRAPAAGAPAPAASVPEAPKSLSAYRAGRAVYRTYCAGCHGESGNGAGPVGHLLSPEPRDFTDAIWMNKQTESYLFSVITNGKPETAMPGFADLLGPADRALALRYLGYFANPVARERMELGFLPAAPPSQLSQ
ncbi:MAG TPA: c-type cytochrome [candidate division Zixibacteria bacterium]|nr:c-type cytochrome [candidate division Zixibacteria bacterium]